jgi:glycosyltransferase involved in cell wall biosynthesis
MKPHNSASPSGHIFYFAKVFASRHGGSIFAQLMVQTLLDDGYSVTLISENLGDISNLSANPRLDVYQAPAFFQRGLRNAFRKAREIISICRLIFARPSSMVMVQGDLPRVTYVLLQLFVPLLLIRQDGILTCPANNRFLPHSRRVCQKPLGFSCIAVDKKEGCLGGLSLNKKLGRIVFRLRDYYLLKMIRNFVANSEYILRVHQRLGTVLYPPRLSISAIVESERDLTKLVFCGRLEVVKGAEEAIQILSRLPEAYRLEILGEGYGLESLQKLAHDLGVGNRVVFRGWVDSIRRDEVFASSGALLMPSIWDEAFGMVGVEAFAQGTPVVAYDVGGISEWCKPIAGILVKCGDLDGFAAALKKITKNQEGWRKFSLAANAIAKSNFTLDEFKRKTRELADSAVPGQKL